MTLPPLVEPGEPLSREEVNRYSRHLLIPNVGMEGQRRIKNAKVLVINVSTPATPTLEYTVALGSVMLASQWVRPAVRIPSPRRAGSCCSPTGDRRAPR